MKRKNFREKGSSRRKEVIINPEVSEKKKVYMPSLLKDRIQELIESRSCAVDIDEAFTTLGEKNKEQFLQKIQELIDEAKIVRTRRDKLIAPSVCGFVPSKIVSYNRGFLFARPLSSGDDIYIPIERARGAMVNDIVMINDVKVSPKGKSGAVERIISLGERLLTGTISRAYKQVEFIADNYYKCPISVKSAFTMGAKSGDKVRVYLYRSRNSYQIMAKVLKIYGVSQCARVCADAIIDKHDIPTEFSKESIEYAKKALNDGINANDLKDRLDLRNEKIFTIDGADAKDLDDAISVERIENGYRLGVHIADVSHYVKENTTLDKEAKERGTSVYFADRVIPMLPKELSNGICSLNGGVDRLTFSAIMELDGKGNLISYEFKKSIICSKVRGVYSEINNIISGDADEFIKEKYSPVMDSIFLADELADILISNAKKRGNMDLESDESKFTLDRKGVCIAISPRTRGKSEKIIEQFMIMANQAAALYAKSTQIPFVYRVHEEPNPEKIRVLSEIAALLGFKTNKLKEGVKSKDFADLLEDASKTKFSRLISSQVLRSMAKARYDEKPMGHFGLSLQDYCHFTSPIRRYPDTSIHRILSSLVAKEPLDKIKEHYENFAKESAFTSSIYEVRAMNAERDTEKCYMAEYMSMHLDEEYEGKISGATKNGIFVQLKNSVEGFVSLDYFENSNFKFDGLVGHTDLNTGKKMVIGDDIKVKVISADVSSGMIDFSPIF